MRTSYKTVLTLVFLAFLPIVGLANMPDTYSAQYFKDSLDLSKHPEGGYYKETHRSQSTVKRSGTNDEKISSSHIYYLLESDDKSVFHRLSSDEVWNFYAGSPISIHEIYSDGTHKVTILGDPSNMLFHYIVLANTWFAATVDEPNSFALVGCTVAPGFEFVEFEIANREHLLAEHIAHRDIIVQLTRKPQNALQPPAYEQSSEALNLYPYSDDS